MGNNTLGRIGVHVLVRPPICDTLYQGSVGWTSFGKARDSFLMHGTENGNGDSIAMGSKMYFYQ
jgi:hypothetical protein